MALEDDYSPGAILGWLRSLSAGAEDVDDCHTHIENKLWWLTKDQHVVKDANERLARFRAGDNPLDYEG